VNDVHIQTTRKIDRRYLMTLHACFKPHFEEKIKMKQTIICFKIMNYVIHSLFPPCSL